MDTTETSAFPSAKLLVRTGLLTGLIATGFLLAVGLATVFWKHELRPAGPPPGLSQLILEAWNGEGVAILDLGLIFLMFTPVARVLVLAVVWTVHREGKMAIIAWGVLTLLCIGMWLGAG